jgi:uncharacterized protein (DUF2062 family)
VKDGKPDPQPPRWQDSFKNALPDRHVLAAHPWLKPVAHRLLDPSLWHARHEAVARGAAIGMFWAFAIPFGQFLFAAAHCVLWRANIPVAAGVTLITNPLTLTFWLWLAYQVGNALLGTNASGGIPDTDASGLIDWLTSYGAPAVLGMAVFAVGGAALAYIGVKLAWRLRIWFRRRGRR